jgi:hypothetical protein
MAFSGLEEMTKRIGAFSRRVNFYAFIIECPSRGEGAGIE